MHLHKLAHRPTVFKQKEPQCHQDFSAVCTLRLDPETETEFAHGQPQPHSCAEALPPRAVPAPSFYRLLVRKT